MADQLEAIEIETAASPGASIIWMHGLGADGHDFVPIVPELELPKTLAVRFVHAPHVAGLSRERRMWVYVSAGTGTWGPPVRFGTSPELTLIRLVRANG